MKKVKQEKINHPAHCGGADNPYEAIKVIEAWKLGFNLGNAVKYISREALKGAPIEDLQKAMWYLQRELENRIAALATKSTARKGTPIRKKTRSGSSRMTATRINNAGRAVKRDKTNAR